MKKWDLLSVLTLAGFTLINPINVSAADKEQSVEINKEAGEAVFCFDFETSQSYDIAITKPSGEVVNSSVNSDETKVSIQDPEIGEYKIYITAPEEINVKSRVELKSEKSIKASSGSVQISSSISNLRLFFMDGKICGTWTDTNLGKVNVTVTNPQNMQKLINTTVSGTSFSFDVPENITEIQIYLVPASSAKVEGAGISYTMEVIRHVPADVIFPASAITNQNSIPVQLLLRDRLSVKVLENNLEVFSSEFESGEHSIEVPLNGTDNNIIVYVIDGKGNINTHEFLIEKDIVAPTIKLKEYHDGEKTTEDTVTITGSVTGADSFTCNGYEVELVQGRFSKELTLDTVGLNEFVFEAADTAGNIATVNVTVEKVAKKKGNLFIAIIPVLLAVGVFAGLKYKKNKAGVTDNKINADLPDADTEPSNEVTDVNTESYEYKANHDEMTGLYNRTAYAKRLSEISKDKMCVIFFDVNNLKKTNDSAGHKAGDKLITTVASAINDVFPGNVYRIGGDEFVVLLESVKESFIKNSIDNICKHLESVSENNEDGINYQAAYGYAFGNKRNTIENTVEKADAAMYRCKKMMKSAGPSEKELKMMADENLTGMRKKLNNKVRKMRRISNICSLILMLVVVGAAIVFFNFAVCNTVVMSGSMEPTLLTGDLVVFNRLSYVANDIQRGDIINFWSEEYGELFSKRVIGIAGDHIEFHDGYVFINDSKCIESYIQEGIETNSGKTFDVPEGTVFVLGDNRENSVDSRYFENPYIPVKDITGKYLGTIHNPFR